LGPHAPSLPMITTNGMPWWIALSYSIALKPNDPSPYTISTCLSGWASFAAMAKEGPTPRQPNGPGSSQWPGWYAWTIEAGMPTMSPPSPTTMASPPTKSPTSPPTPRGSLGLASSALPAADPSASARPGEVRGVRREAPPPQRVEEHGDLERVGQLPQRVVGVRPPDARPGEHDGPLGVVEQPDGLLHQVRVALWLGGGPGPGRRRGVARRVELDVQRDVQEHGAAPAGGGVAERRRHEVGQLARVVARLGPLRDGGDQRDLVHL